MTEGAGPLIINLSTKRELSGQLHAPAALPLGKNPQFTVDKNLGGLQSPSARFEKEDDILLLSGFDPRFLGLLGAVLHCYRLIQNGVLSLSLVHCSVSVRGCPRWTFVTKARFSTCVRMSAKVWDFNFVIPCEHFVVARMFKNCGLQIIEPCP